MIQGTAIDSLIDSMEDLDPAREKAPLIDLVRGPLAKSVNALERRSHELPTGQDFHFYSNFQDYRRPVADVRSRVVGLLSQLGSLKDVVPHPSAFPGDVDEGYDWLVGVQDAFLERVDASLDKFYLERKAESNKLKPELNAFEASSKQSLSMKTPRPARTASEGSKTGDVKVARGKDKSAMRSPIPFHIPSIPRPQDRFDDAVDNSNSPFRHKAVKGRMQMESAVSNAEESGKASGNTSAVSVLEEHARKLGHRGPADNAHPLEEELTKMAYVEGLLDTVEIRKYGSLGDTPFTFVTTLRALKEMAVKLRKAGEIAIDLENHHYRSYQGFVCLMQVSTRDEDFIVDTLDLRSQIRPCLGDIFADPTIKKVMHGADRDIVWLQRDFGIYVCNLFDTGQAARVLQLQGFGLAFLLEHFCDVHADKRYQLADWRIRPLPAEMIKYAREDTHYLLYVHDMLKQLLVDTKANKKVEEDDPVTQVYKRSRDLCLQLYTKEIFTETSYQNLYGLPEKKLRPEQLAVLAALFSWRDTIARKEDESTGFVLPNHLLLQLASEMPDDVRQLQSFVKGSHSYVSRHVSAVIQIIRQSKEKALRELQEAYLEPGDPEEPEEGEVKGESTRTSIVSHEMNMEVSKVTHSLHIKETVQEVDEEGRMGTSVSSTTLETETLATPIETRAVSRLPALDTITSETTASDKAGHSISHTRSGDGHLKPTSDVVTGSVVVSRKITPVPVPSSNVPVIPKERDRTSEVPDSPTQRLMGLPKDSSPENVDQAMPDIGTEERDSTSSLDEEQGLGHPQERTVSESLTAAVEAVDRAGDEPFSVSETLALQVTQREEKTPHIEVNATAVDESIIPGSFVIEKVSENAPIIQAKRKPSKLGSLLGGRKKVQQTGPSESSKDVEQGRMKTQEIESSLVLPFGPPVESLADMSGTNEQPLFAGGVQAVTIPAENLDHCRGIRPEETARQIDETSERPAGSTAPEILPDVLMFETEADDEDITKSTKHRMWWPPVGEVSGKQRKTDSARDQTFDGDRNPDIPIPLSEMHRNSRRGKKGRNHSAVSSNGGNPEVPARDFGAGGSGSRKKRRKNGQSEVDTQVKTMPSTDNGVDFTSFNYREARNVLGLNNVFTQKGEEVQGTGSNSRGRGRGRGSKKDSNRPGIPLSKTAFDPLRRTREEPRPEGIKPGQRRQVFPQSGNRTAVFKQ